ncbi:MAG: RluA family pseudouridine synthase [Gemmatimonadota bacterium]
MDEAARDYIGASLIDSRADDDIDEGGDLAATRRFTATAAHRGLRVDKVLALLLPEVSRTRIQQWIEQGAIRINGVAPRARDAVVEGDAIEVAPPPAPDALAFAPEAMALDIVTEDDSIIVLDKPPGLVVHPAAGNWSGTLLNGLLAHDANLAQVPRAGIVHRLDAGTSGLMVVARTVAAQTDLVRQLQARSVLREYWAIVVGATPLAGTIDAAIGRDPRNPVKFRVSRASSAREARTSFRRIECIDAGGIQLSWVACRLHTGRTHQIRVHFESIGHPLVGDPLYRRGRPAAAGQADTGLAWAIFPRQALHACRLAFLHPVRGERMEWFRPPPADMQRMMRAAGFGRCDRARDVFG